MTLRLQNFFMAIMLAVVTLAWAQSFASQGNTFFEKPAPQNSMSGGYQLFEASDLGNFADNPLSYLEKIFASPETAPECCNAPKGTPQITINRQNGAEFEQQVVDALGPVGGVKNTTPQTVTLSDGTVVTTIPDLWGRNVGGILEAKNVQELSRSPQLRAQAELARQTGEPMNLVVSPRTQTVSGPLLENVRSTGGNVYVYDPASDSLTSW